MSSFDVKLVAFQVFADLAVKKNLKTAKKINNYFKITTGSKLLKGDYLCHEPHEYANMSAKMILDGLPKYEKDPSDD